MAGFVDTLRGEWLARAQRALAGLEGDPPPPYTSDRSGTTTRSQSPNPPSEEQRRRQERRMQLGRERVASQPYNQFEHQTSEEKKRILEADLNGTRSLRVGDDYSEIAYKNVKERWVEQGIWNNKWNKFPSRRWKHEEPLELESESETDSEAESSPPLFSFFPAQPQPKSRRQKSYKEKQQIAERRVIREREREASRPYHQFIYQISKERERIRDDSTSRDGTSTSIPDINTMAYENVKNTWTKRGIWNKRWGILPGMSWKHEEPLEEDSADDPMPVSETATRNAQPPVSNGAGPAPFAPLFAPLPQVEPDHLQGPRDEEPLRFLADPNSFFHLRNAQPPADHEAGKAPLARDPPIFGPHSPFFGPRPPVEPNHPHGSRGPKPLLERTIGKYGGLYDGDLREEMIANGFSPDFYAKLRPNIRDDRPSEDGPAPVNGNHGAREAPTRRIFGSPSPVESNHRQASGALDSSQQGPSADIDSAGLENSNAERSPSTLNSPRLRTGKRVSFFPTGQPSQPSKRNHSHKDGQLASAPLSPVYSSKVSKAAVKKKPGPQRRLNISQKVSSAGLPLSSDVDEAKPPSSSPNRAAPRRSKRIQPPVPTVSEDLTRTASSGPSKRAVRSKPERNVISSLTARSSVRPQGILKKQPAKITRGRARKEKLNN